MSSQFIIQFYDFFTPVSILGTIYLKFALLWSYQMYRHTYTRTYTRFIMILNESHSRRLRFSSLLPAGQLAPEWIRWFLCEKLAFSPFLFLFRQRKQFTTLLGKK